jgi:1-acyl-sn-glycerol-3-phosphate acyltransferase
MIISLARLVRTLISLFDLCVITLATYLLSFLPQRWLDVGRWYRRLFRYWCWVFIRALDVTLHLHQKNLHPLPKQYILIGNHPSAFEDLGMSALFDVLFLAKEEIKQWWILGRISQACGTFYVKRENKDSRQQAAQTLREALAKNINIGIYPEGGCKGRRIFTPFRYGVFELSMDMKIPIVPVFLHYESQEDFEWQSQSLLKKLWMIRRSQNRHANYYIYDAIDPARFATKEDFCEYVQNLYLTWQTQYLE